MDYRDAMQHVIDIIEERLYEEIDTEVLAAHAGYSYYHFQRIFRDTVGMSPASYIRRRRLTEIVRRMTYDDRPIYEIAFACVESGAVDTAWNLDYYLGTYAALKAHAAAFYDRHRADHPVCDTLAAEYRIVADAWNHAYQCKRTDTAPIEKRKCIIDALRTAHAAEIRALAVMETV